MAVVGTLAFAGGAVASYVSADTDSGESFGGVVRAGRHHHHDDHDHDHDDHAPHCAPAPVRRRRRPPNRPVPSSIRRASRPSVPTTPVAGLLFDRLVEQGVEPNVANCAISTAYETASEEELLAMGIAQANPEAIAIVTQGALDCGIPRGDDRRRDPPMPRLSGERSARRATNRGRPTARIDGMADQWNGGQSGPGERWNVNLPAVIGVVFVFLVGVIVWVIAASGGDEDGAIPGSSVPSVSTTSIPPGLSTRRRLRSRCRRRHRCSLPPPHPLHRRLPPTAPAVTPAPTVAPTPAPTVAPDCGADDTRRPPRPRRRRR